MNIGPLLPADYALLGLTVTLALLGLFRGLSGTLAFILATGAAALTAALGWPYSVVWLQEIWARAGLTLVGTLLVFGIVRIIVRKLVNGLLAQPADAIFGLLVGILTGVVIAGVWAWSGIGLEYSSLATALVPAV